LKKTNRNSHFEENQQEQPLWRKPTGTATLKKTNRNSHIEENQQEQRLCIFYQHLIKYLFHQKQNISWWFF
jgi:hypothetical protein